MVDLGDKILRTMLIFVVTLLLAGGTAAVSEGRVVRRVYPEQPRSTFTPVPYFTGKIGIFNPNDENFPDGLEGFSSGVFSGFNIGYRSAPFFAIEGEVDYYESDFGPEDLRVIPVLFNARFIYPGGIFEPYIGGGAGIYFAEFEFFNGLFFETDDGAGVGVHLGTGVDFQVSPGIILGFEFRWFFAEPDFSDDFGPDPDVGGFTFNFLLRTLF